MGNDDPPRKTFALDDEEMDDYLDQQGNASEYIRKLIREDMARSNDERERLEQQLADINEEIDEVEEELSQLKEKRERIREKLEELDERREEQIGDIIDGLALLSGIKPEHRETGRASAKKAADRANMTEQDIIQLAEDIDLGHPDVNGTPDDITDEEKDRVEEWVEENL